MKNFVQIGANDGNDEFRTYTESISEESNIYLFEPNPNLIPVLQQSYSNSIHKVNIFNMAIGPVASGDIELNVYDHSGLSSMINRKSYGNSHRKISISCITFDDFCKHENISKIDYLSVDTEGLDYEILLSIMLDKVEIDEIVFEVWPYDNDDMDDNYQTGPSVLQQVLDKYVGYNHNQIVYGGMNSYHFTKK